MLGHKCCLFWSSLSILNNLYILCSVMYVAIPFYSSKLIGLMWRIIHAKKFGLIILLLETAVKILISLYQWNVYFLDKRDLEKGLVQSYVVGINSSTKKKQECNSFPFPGGMKTLTNVLWKEDKIIGWNCVLFWSKK